MLYRKECMRDEEIRRKMLLWAITLIPVSNHAVLTFQKHRERQFLCHRTQLSQWAQNRIQLYHLIMDRLRSSNLYFQSQQKTLCLKEKTQRLKFRVMNPASFSCPRPWTKLQTIRTAASNNLKSPTSRCLSKRETT